MSRIKNPEKRDAPFTINRAGNYCIDLDKQNEQLNYCINVCCDGQMILIRKICVLHKGFLILSFPTNVKRLVAHFQTQLFPRSLA